MRGLKLIDIDITRSIVPGIGIPDLIELDKPASFYERLLRDIKRKHEAEILFNLNLSFTIEEILVLTFHINNPKLWLIEFLPNYQGGFDGIKTGMTIEEVNKTKEKLHYNEKEEYWYYKIGKNDIEKGIIFVANGNYNCSLCSPKQPIRKITVFKE